MDTVQSVSKSLKLVSCALTSMRWLDIIKKLIADSDSRLLGAEHNSRVQGEKVKKRENRL